MRILHSNPTKIQKEHSFFEAYLLATRNCLQIERWEKGDSPDYILYISNERIGLEITALVREELAAIRTAQTKCLQKAKEFARQRGLPIVEVGVEFRSNRDPIDIGKAAIELVEFIEKNISNVYGARFWNCYESDLIYCKWIKIRLEILNGRKRTSDYRFELIPQNFQRRAPTNIDEIQSRIDEKQSKISDYLKKCDKCWLLIGVNEWVAPEAVAITEELESHVFSGDFQRLFFLRNIEDRMVELRINNH